MEKNTFLITGGTGFIGSNLIEALLEANNKVILVKRSFSKLHRLTKFQADIKTINIDECIPGSFFNDFQKIDAIVHCATSYGRKGEAEDIVFDANFNFPLSLIKIALKNNCTTFFNIDSILPANLNLYSRTKDQFRRIGELLSEYSNLNFINVKFGQIVGPNDDETKFIPSLFRNLVLNIEKIDLTLGEQKQDYIYIDDAISALLLIINKDIRNISSYKNYCVGNGSSVSLREFTSIAKKIAKSTTTLNYGAIPYRKNETMDVQLNIKNLEMLGWKKKYSTEDAIDMCIKYYQESIE